MIRFNKTLLILGIILLTFVQYNYAHAINKNAFNRLSTSLNNSSTQNEKLVDSILMFRTLARQSSDSLHAEEAVYYAKKYIRSTQDLTIINDHFFEKINQTDVYLNFKSRYQIQINLLTIFYLFAALLGLYLFVILNTKKGIDRSSTLLMSLFVLFHSLFILHLSLYLINCQYYFPHTLLYSTAFTLLYGPLIYFYFKKTISNYKFKWYDVLHFIPTIVLLAYIFPFYKLSASEKFIILFDQVDILGPQANIIMIVKIVSLIAYALLTWQLYLRGKEQHEKKSPKLLWQRNIVAIYFVYVIAFIIYIAVTAGYFDDPVFFHFQILVMVGLVFYVAYITYAQPEIFKGEIKLVDPIELFKYKKSGLTESFSKELSAELVDLLEVEKVYKRSDLNLSKLSDILGTTRHNTSQVINEHFNMNYFELINKFRIDEAIEIINNDTKGEYNIIDIAYQVGYNNKVTFNKAFKKVYKVTPSQYIKSVRDARV